MKIYLDNCALGRPFDSEDQPRVREEAAAVKTILGLVKSGIHRWISSQVLEFEILANPDEARRRRTLDQLTLAMSTQQLSGIIIAHSAELRRQGFGNLDALHLAATIHAGCDALLTTDDRFVRKAARTPSIPAGLVLNPVDFLRR